MARERQQIDVDKYDLISTYVSKNGIKVNTYCPKHDNIQDKNKKEQITEECIRILKKYNRL